MLTDIEALLRKGENMGKNDIKRTNKRDKYRDQLDKEIMRNCKKQKSKTQNEFEITF